MLKYSNSLMSDLDKKMKKRKTKLVHYKKTLLKHQLTKRQETGIFKGLITIML